MAAGEELLDLSQDRVGVGEPKGSMGQQVINPLISELRQHRATLASLLGRLNLPDEATDSVPRSVQARDAAHARWRGRP
jgi:hypothetical protein